jgi:2-oxoacid dehydrogenases acyltransferase (catalytic domain).
MKKSDKLKYYGWSPGDRYDGWRIRKVDPLFSVVPFILSKRAASEVFFEVKIPIDEIENFIRSNKSEIPDLSIMHVVMASLVRLFSQRPYLNRFIVWNKIFARNHLSFAIAIKRSLTDEGEETVMKTYYLPTDTLQDVVRKTKLGLESNKKIGQKNTSDNISKLMGFLPDFLLRAVISGVKLLDNIGLMPEFFFDASPFHASLFLSNLGSIGIESIYHHLYEFGSCSVFVTMGRKSTENVVDKEGADKQVKSILLKFVIDERICDGFYFASSMRMFEKILWNPDSLLVPPEQVFVDEGVGKERRDL